MKTRTIHFSEQLFEHQQRLQQCKRCSAMYPPVITGNPVDSPILLVGQAPGIHEAEVQRPFGWTAGKTLFQWFTSIGLQEEAFRQKVYMAAVCRCFPGKNPKGGDRVPSKQEIASCAPWLQNEIELLQPQLILPVGKLAINQFLQVKKLQEVIGSVQRLPVQGREVDVIALPHPSGASTWHRMEPGKSLLQDALQQLAKHPAWQALLQAEGG